MNTSVYTTLLRSVQNVILGLNLPGAPEVKRRKHPLVAADDTLPIILVTPEKESLYGENVENSVFLEYPVRVTICYPGNMLLETDVDRLLDWREVIRQKLHVTSLAGSPRVFDANIDLDPPFDPQFYQANLDKSSILFTYRASELRSV